MIKGSESAMSHEQREGKALLESEITNAATWGKRVMPLSSNNRLMTSMQTDSSKRHDHTQ